MSRGVLRAWIILLARRNSPRMFRPELQGRLNSPQLASFLAESDRRLLKPGLHELAHRGRKVGKVLLYLALFAGTIWVLVESAKALAIF